MAGDRRDDKARREIAARLKQAREWAGLTQREAAALLGVDRVSVTNIENGTRNCYAQELRQLCVTYRVSADWVLGFSESRDLAAGVK